MSFISVLIVLVILSITVATGYFAISPAILGQKAEPEAGPGPTKALSKVLVGQDR